MGEETVNITGVTYEDLSGGLNSDRFSTEVSDKDSLNCENTYYYDGRLRKIFGTTRINTTINGANNLAPVTGVHDFQLRSGTRHAVVTLSDSIWRRNGNAWTNITGAHVITNVQHQFITFNDSVN